MDLTVLTYYGLLLIKFCSLTHIHVVTLRARNDTGTANVTANATLATFRGFIIQARDMNDSPVGEFADPSSMQPLTRLSSCEPPTISVTHNNPNRIDMDSVTFTWRAPTIVMTGPIRFE